MSSTYERTGVRKSRIVLSLTPGNVTTAPRSDVMYVVTEYGMVNLKGSRSLSAQGDDLDRPSGLSRRLRTSSASAWADPKSFV
jgi:hypothetical protein